MNSANRTWGQPGLVCLLRTSEINAIHTISVHREKRTGGQPGLVRQLRQRHRRPRILLARLQHKRVARCNCNGKHPQGDHRREVEGADAGAHTEGLPHAVAVDVFRNVLEVRAAEVVANPRRRLHHLQKL